MSILLESLDLKSAQQHSAQTPVPDLHASHFDEEMLGDDKLYSQLDRWKKISIGLMTLLVFSWGYFYFAISTSPQSNLPSTGQASIESVNSPNEKTPQAINAAQAQTLQSPRSEKTIAEKTTAEKARSENPTLIMPVSESPASEVRGSEIAQSEPATSSSEPATTQTKQYKPVKRELASKAEPPVNTIASTSSSVNRIAQSQNSIDSAAKIPLESAIYKHQLPVELRNQFPLLTINQYVISDTAKDSFVILDGSFYQPDQMISPDMILRHISKQNIIVEFHAQLVKIPLK